MASDELEAKLREAESRACRAEMELGQLRFKLANLSDASVENDRLRAALALVETGVDGVWLWQGDGGDDPRSLSCPVVMSSEKLREITGELGRLRVAVAGRECDHSPPADGDAAPSFGTFRTCLCGRRTYRFSWGGSNHSGAWEVVGAGSAAP